MANREERLGIVVDAEDRASGKLGRIEAKAKSLERAGVSGIGRIAARAGAVEKSFGRVGTGLSGAIGRIRSGVSGIMGALGPLLGLGAGALGGIGLAKFFTDAISKAEDFAQTSTLVARTIGTNVGNASQIVDLLDKYGIGTDKVVTVLGRATKNLTAIAAAQAKVTKSSKGKTFGIGFSVIDAHGKPVDPTELLSRSRDYFNSTASATEKATFLSKLYGKTWQDLIPVLSLSRKEFDKQYQTALRLTPQQIKDAAALRNAQREFNDTLGDTQTLVGLTILPNLTKVVRVANSFIQNNQGKIVGAVQGAIKLAGQIGDAFIAVASGVSRVWGAIPDPMKDLLIKGLIANKAIKMTLGVDILGGATKGITGAIGSALGGLLGRGSSPANALWVQSAQGGVGGGPLGGGKGGGLSPLGVLGAAAGGLSVAAWWKGTFQDPQFDAQVADIARKAAAQIKTNQNVGDLKTQLAAVQTGIRELSNAGPISDTLYGGQIEGLKKVEAAYQAAIAKIEKLNAQAQVASAIKRQGTGRGPGADVRRDMTVAVREGNRDLPRRRDLTDQTYRWQSALRQGLAGVQAIERTGFGTVVTVLWAVQAAVKGIPGSLGAQMAKGRPGGGEGNRGTPAPLDTSNDGQNRGPGRRTLAVKVSASHRDIAQAGVTSRRYGPTAADTGAT